MIRPHTLRGRLSLAALSVGAFAVVVLTMAFNLVLLHVQHSHENALLRDGARAVRDTVQVRNGRLILPPEAHHDLDSNVWIFQGETALDAPNAPHWLRDTASSLAGTNGQQVRRDEPKPVALYSLAVPLHGRQVGTVVAAISLEPYTHSAQVVFAGSAVLSGALLLLLWVLTRALVVRALTPVEAMTATAREWSHAGATERFGAYERPTELDDLATTLDDLLDRHSAVLGREQRLTAEISHELRTPLAAILAETELFEARPRTAEEAQATIGTVAQLAARMERILEALLSAARAPSAAGRSDADAVVAAAVTALGATRVPVVVEPGDGTTLGVEQALAERALAPLLANALRYAETAVVVRVEAAGPAVQVLVSDDGPGVPAQDAEAVFEPGVRLEDGHDGAGLGLALARRLARAAGGDVTCEPREHGAAFVLTLPRG